MTLIARGHLLCFSPSRVARLEGCARTRWQLEVFTDSGDARAIVAISKWVYPHTLTPEEKEAKENPAPKEPYPPGYNAALATDFFGRIMAKRSQYIDPEKDYCELPFACVIHSHPPLYSQQRLVDY